MRRIDQGSLNLLSIELEFHQPHVLDIEAMRVLCANLGWIREGCFHSCKKKKLFSILGGAKSPPQDYAKVAAAEHPMSINMRKSLEQALTKDPQMALQTDDRGFNLLHQLSLAGSWDGVDVCLKHGVDPKVTALNGMTPFALAKCLGWKRVMERLQQAGAT